MTATDMAARIRRRQLSPVEVVDAVIERIEQRNPSLNAFIYKGYDDARRRAEQAEHAVLAGEELGPLHGVPTAMKDLFDFKPGWPATFGGVRAFKDLVIDAYCVFAERIERAGAILIGKTNSPVMGFRGVTDNYLFGPTSNPFDTTVNTGGSSGGSAAAVADGLVPFAEGTDGGGSIRIPAAWCGVYGYKASFGRVPMVMRPDAFAGTNPFIYEGPLSRTVEDAALVLNALSGYDARDPYSLDESVDFLPATRRGIRGLRIAYSPDLDVYPVDPRIAKVVRDAVDAFKEAGAHVEEVKLGLKRDQRELSDLWCRLIIPLSCVGFERMRAGGFDVLGEHRDDFPPEFLHWVDSGMGTTVLEQLADQEMRTEVYDALQGVLGNYDLLVTPTLAAMQVKNGTDGNTLGPAEVDGVEVDRLIGWCMTYFCNFSGHPAASIPAGFADGLPVGMQIIGRRYADADVLAASAAFERLRPWHDSYARCAERPLA
jgi:amidase/aspartyl-tRNA(Asn)/glutamyl-tRNA(Gln) amidotransferase subunit A